MVVDPAPDFEQPARRFEQPAGRCRPAEGRPSVHVAQRRIRPRLDGGGDLRVRQPDHEPGAAVHGNPRARRRSPRDRGDSRSRHGVRAAGRVRRRCLGGPAPPASGAHLGGSRTRGAAGQHPDRGVRRLADPRAAPGGGGGERRAHDLLRSRGPRLSARDRGSRRSGPGKRRPVGGELDGGVRRVRRGRLPDPGADRPHRHRDRRRHVPGVGVAPAVRPASGAAATPPRTASRSSTRSGPGCASWPAIRRCGR